MRKSDLHIVIRDWEIWRTEGMQEGSWTWYGKFVWERVWHLLSWPYPNSP